MILSPAGISPTTAELASTEARLLKLLDARDVVWCGRGATALCIAYRAAVVAGAPCDRPEVILPATGCASLASTAIASGLVPRFADVHPSTGMSTLSEIARLYGPRTRAVVYIHLFGNTSDLHALRTWATANRVILIEDIAHSFGAVLPGGRWAGSVGDLAICSFSSTKIIDCGGGALVTRSAECEQSVQRAIEDLSPVKQHREEDISALELSYKNVQTKHIALHRSVGECDAEARDVLGRTVHDELWIQPLRSAWTLAGRIQELPTALVERERKALLYDSKLRNGGPWRVLDGWQHSGVCWRFSLLLDEAAVQVPLSEALRAKGFHVSNLYWPLTDLFARDPGSPGANDFSSRILNLFLDSFLSPEYVTECAEVLCYLALQPEVKRIQPC